MNSLTLFWVAIGIIFLIVEMITVTFYGLAISIAGFLTAVYVWYMRLMEVTIAQGVVFALVTILTSYYLPRFLISRTIEHSQGLDTYIGETRRVKKVGEDHKISLDGIDYLIDIDDVQEGDRVQIVTRKGSIFYGNILD